MSQTTVALFNDLGNAENAVNELLASGFTRDDISIVANREVCGPNVGPVTNIGADSRVGTGAAVGGLAGFVAGILALAIPGIGPILAAGPLTAAFAGAGVGAAAGGLVGALRRVGVSDQDTGEFCEAIRRGGVLVTVSSSDVDAQRAEEILERHGAVDLHAAAARWRERGWTGFDPNAEPAPIPRSDSGAGRLDSLPFDPDDIMPSKREERRGKRAVRSYTRVT
jgi:uncharacterized membrane protein